MTRFLVCSFASFFLLLYPAPAEEEQHWFTNVAQEKGLSQVSAQRAAFVDLDNDGFLDCVLQSIWKDRSTHVFLNEAGKVFNDFTQASCITKRALAGGERTANVLVFADVDNDGDMDVFSGVYCDLQNPEWTGDPSLRSAILLNNGKGVFEVLKESGVAEPPATTCAATFFDYDNDGHIDLFVGNWYREYGTSYGAYQDRLYRGMGQGEFQDVTEEAGLVTDPEPGKKTSSKPVYGTGHLDFNNDGYQDMAVCVYGRQWNFLWKNLGQGKFMDVAEDTGFDGDGIRHGKYSPSYQELLKNRDKPPREAEEPFRSNGNTFSLALADYDCDGDVDLFLGEIAHWWAGESSDRSCLLINQGKAEGYIFRRDPEAIPRQHENTERWNEGDIHVAWLDFNNDGLEDLLISSGDYPDSQFLRLFQQEEDHGFTDVTKQSGFAWESSAGISIGDYDRDGDLDILAGKSWTRIPSERRQGDHPGPALFRNEVGHQNNWISISLKGKGVHGSNRMGIGARITIEASGIKQMREIQGGCGHCGQFNPPEAHFGIGKASIIDKISVRWPNSGLKTQTFERVAPNQRIRITEGERITRIKLDPGS